MTTPGNHPLFEANGCLRKAGNRLQDARALLEDGIGTNEGCCFASHQTGEMSLKGLIWYHTGEIPERTHDLQSLRQTLEGTAFVEHPDFPSITNSIFVVENHYIGVRYVYEDGYGNIKSDYTRQEAEDSLAAATLIYEIARSVVPAWEPNASRA